MDLPQLPQCGLVAVWEFEVRQFELEIWIREHLVIGR